MSGLVGEGGCAPERVLVVRALPGVGDLLCAVPAWRALRAALPDSAIALLGLPEAQTVLARIGRYIDEVIPFTGYPGIVESRTTDPARIARALIDVQARRFDLAIQMQGSGLVTNALTVLLGARATAGFYLPGQYCPDPGRFLPYPADQPEVRRHLRLMTFLGAPSRGEDLEFYTLPEDEAERAEIQKSAGIEGAYACIHPGASIAARRWSPDGFAQVGDALANDGLHVVITGGRDEREITAAVAAAMRAPAVDVGGATTLGGLAALMAGSRITVTNDTGTSHLAAALGVPSVVVFTTSDPRRWAPLDVERHIAVGYSPTSPHAGEVRTGEPRCLRDGCTAPDTKWVPRPPSTQAVLRAARQLLAAPSPN